MIGGSVPSFALLLASAWWNSTPADCRSVAGVVSILKDLKAAKWEQLDPAQVAAIGGKLEPSIGTAKSKAYSRDAYVAPAGSVECAEWYNFRRDRDGRVRQLTRVGVTHLEPDENALLAVVDQVRTAISAPAGSLVRASCKRCTSDHYPMTQAKWVEGDKANTAEMGIWQKPEGWILVLLWKRE